MTCNKMADVSAEELIPLVEQRSVIWDKKSDVYKDKALKAVAWKEICYVLNPDLDQLEEEEKKDFVKSVSTKWIHIKDAFLRSQKVERKKTRTGAKKPRPYVYKNLLSFLTNVYDEPQTRTKHDSFNESQTISSDSSSDEDIPTEQPYQPPPAKKSFSEEKNPLVEENLTRYFDSKASSQYEHPQISFMKGILPSLATFDDDENLEFQAGVVALIQKIRRKRQGPGAFSSTMTNNTREYCSESYDVKPFQT